MPPLQDEKAKSPNSLEELGSKCSAEFHREIYQPLLDRLVALAQPGPARMFFTSKNQQDEDLPDRICRPSGSVHHSQSDPWTLIPMAGGTSDWPSRGWQVNSDAGTLQGWGSLATPEPAPELTPGQQAHAAAAEAFERAAAAATPESYHPKGETEEADEAEEDPKIDIEALQALLRDNAAFFEVCNEAVKLASDPPGQLSSEPQLQFRPMPGAPTVRLPASFGVTNSFAQKLWGSMFLTPPVLLYEVQSFSSALNHVCQRCEMEPVEPDEADDLWDGPMDADDLWDGPMDVGVFYQFAREQDRKLEVRAAACTAAMHACCKQDLDEVEPARAVMDLFQQMLSWSVRPYDGTLAAVVKSESKLGTWPQALWRLELIRGRGISKLVRSYTAAAEACEASEACDWERSMQLVEISQERSRREADKFLERTFPPAITALSRGAHWHLALHAHRRLQRLPRGARMTVKAYTELIRACGQGPSWSEVLGLLDEMYLAKLSPSPETFEAVAEALASRGSCGDTSEASAWIVQLDEELQLNNLRPTPRMSELAMEARRSLGMTEEFELGTDLIEESL
eukprot:g15919.t1